MSQFDERSVVVYQAYRPAIGHFAAEHGYFGGEFSLGRMSWIKPNFLWMMYRSGWGTKQGQEVTLAVRIKREAFDLLLSLAIPSSYWPDRFPNHDAWKKAVTGSNVRLQWDPDHDPLGGKVERRAIQLGMRGEALASYSRDWILEIEDISDFVAQQRDHALRKDYDKLMLPQEEVYSVTDPSSAHRIGLLPDKGEGALNDE